MLVSFKKKNHEQVVQSLSLLDNCPVMIIIFYIVLPELKKVLNLWIKLVHILCFGNKIWMTFYSSWPLLDQTTPVGEREKSQPIDADAAAASESQLDSQIGIASFALDAKRNFICSDLLSSYLVLAQILNWAILGRHFKMIIIVSI